MFGSSLGDAVKAYGGTLRTRDDVFMPKLFQLDNEVVELTVDEKMADLGNTFQFINSYFDTRFYAFPE